jgi:hypothetical protein
MFSKVQIRNSLCAFHVIFTILEVTNNFPSTLQHSVSGKHVLLIARIPLNLPIPLVSIPSTIVPSWNRHINTYVYGIFGFANKYMEDNGTIIIFHDDDPHILKEIKSLETNIYEIHFRWAIINSLL